MPVFPYNGIWPTIADDVFIAPGAVVIGNVTIHGATVGNRVLIAMNAVVLSHAQVGSNTIIGACTLVGEYKQIPEGVLAVGAPAKVLRELSEEEQERIINGTNRYYEFATAHKKSLADASSNPPMSP